MSELIILHRYVGNFVILRSKMQFIFKYGHPVPFYGMIHQEVIPIGILSAHKETINYIKFIYKIFIQFSEIMGPNKDDILCSIVLYRLLPFMARQYSRHQDRRSKTFLQVGYTD